MKCPDCGDATEQQINLGGSNTPPENTGFYCAVCGRLYVVDGILPGQESDDKPETD